MYSTRETAFPTFAPIEDNTSVLEQALSLLLIKLSSVDDKAAKEAVINQLAKEDAFVSTVH